MSSDLLDRLKRHYIKPGEQFPGGVFLPECGWNGGGPGTRCDALYVGFTANSGRLLVGHELKVSRSDWLRELDQPGKADPWHDQTHEWYLVVPDQSIVKPGELPAGWGLMTPNPRTKNRMTIATRSARRTRDPSWEACRSIIARLDTLQAGQLADVRLQVLDDARARIEQELALHAQDTMDPETRNRLHLLDRLEERLGMRLDLWSADHDHVAPETLARAVKIAQSLDQVSGYRGLVRTAETLESAAMRLRQTHEDIEQIQGSTS